MSDNPAPYSPSARSGVRTGVKKPLNTPHQRVLIPISNSKKMSQLPTGHTKEQAPVTNDEVFSDVDTEKFNAALELLEKHTELVSKHGGLVVCRKPKAGHPFNLYKEHHYIRNAFGPKTKPSINRIAYLGAHGEIPYGKEITNLCDDKDCCKPAHLIAAPRAEILSRARCIGVMKYSNGNKFVVACKHTPICRKITFYEKVVFLPFDALDNDEEEEEEAEEEDEEEEEADSEEKNEKK